MNTRKKILYSNGCSHTAGCEITYPLSETFEDKNLSFSGQLASRWNLISINDAKKGQGNFSILSQTLHSVFKLLEKYNSDEIIVLVGWSGLDRVDFVSDNTVYQFNSTTCKSSWPDKIKKAWELWVLENDGNLRLNKFSLYYFTLVNFLESYGIEYYMFNAVNPLSISRENLLHEKREITLEIFKHIEMNNRYLHPFNPDYVYHTYLKNSGFDGFSEGRSNHFLESAHIYWANFIQSYIIENNPSADWIVDSWPHAKE